MTSEHAKILNAARTLGNLCLQAEQEPQRFEAAMSTMAVLLSRSKQLQPDEETAALTQTRLKGIERHNEQLGEQLAELTERVSSEADRRVEGFDSSIGLINGLQSTVFAEQARTGRLWDTANKNYGEILKLAERLNIVPTPEALATLSDRVYGFAVDHKKMIESLAERVDGIASEHCNMHSQIRFAVERLGAIAPSPKPACEHLKWHEGPYQGYHQDWLIACTCDECFAALFNGQWFTPQPPSGKPEAAGSESKVDM